MSVTVPFQQPERRRATRTALHLHATMRDGSRKAEARVIDMSTHGCRIACSTVVADDSWVSVSYTHLTLPTILLV